MRTNRLSTTQLDLELEVFNRRFYIDRTEFLNRNNTKISTYPAEQLLGGFLDHQVVQLQHFVYCGKPKKEVHEVKYPAGWWNAFKAEYPRLCRWFAPPKYVTVRVSWEGRVAFPELELKGRYQTVQIWKDCVVEELGK